MHEWKNERNYFLNQISLLPILIMRLQKGQLIFFSSRSWSIEAATISPFVRMCCFLISFLSPPQHQRHPSPHLWQPQQSPLRGTSNMSSVHFQVPRGSSSTQIQLSPSLLFKVAAFPLAEPSLCDRPEKVELFVPRASIYFSAEHIRNVNSAIDLK